MGSDNLKVVDTELGHGAAQEQHAVALTQIQLSATRCRAQLCQWVETRVEADQLDNVLRWIEVSDDARTWEISVKVRVWTEPENENT